VVSPFRAVLLRMASVVVGVVGGRGGVGASTFAAALAAAAKDSVLIDADPLSPGIDVLVGIESVPGARWSGVQLNGGHLDPALLDRGLPRWGGVRVLAADVAPSAEHVVQVVEAAAELWPVIIDLPRAPGDLRDLTLTRCMLAVLVTSASVAPLAAARRLVGGLPDVPLAMVMRRGAVTKADASELLGVPVLASLSEPPRGGEGVPAPWIRTARAVLTGLDGARDG
jgi:hypothetical protein